MAGVTYNDLMFRFTDGLLRMCIGGMIWVWAWVIWRLLTRRPILPEQPLVSDVRPSWGSGTVLLVLLLAEVVGLLTTAGHRWATGELPKKPSSVAVTVADPAPIAKQKAVGHPVLDPAKPANPADGESKEVRGHLSWSQMMLLVSVSNSVLLILVPLLVRFTSGARMRDFGVCLRGWMRQAAVGVGAMMFVCPIVYLVQFAAVQIWSPTQHPLETMLKDNFSPRVVCLAFISAVVLAPMTEELMFRAIVQGWLSAWLARRNARVRHPLKPSEPWQPESDGGPAADHWKVDVEIDAMHGEAAPIPADAGHDPTRRNFWPAVVLTSLFFGILHMAQWPAPISIFVLALALGAVYQRTGSLIAAIFMHATFNGLSTVAAIAVILASQAAAEKKEETIPSKTTIKRLEPVALGRQWVIKANGKQ